MKRIIFGILALVLVLSFTAAAAAPTAPKGPFVDKVFFDVRMQEEIGIKDTEMGKTDLFMNGLPRTLIRGLDKDALSALEQYVIPSGSTSLLLNPIPNKAPYLHKVDNKDVFNPLAIREVRFALNFLINRKYIVDEILGGSGLPMYTITTPGQPGTIPYELNAAKLGFTAEGDEARALAEINAAMTEASKLDALNGKLKKNGKYWEYNGDPLLVKFIIRVDDPNVRVKEGEYISAQLEKAGFKVEKLMWDRSKASNEVYGGNPADYNWTMYTEGWGAGATRAWWAHIVAQFYGPWYGYMPGGATEGVWNYENPKIDELSQKAYSGDVLTAKEYWDSILEAQTLGLKEAVRIMLAVENQTFVANKEAFTQRMAYGLGDGICQWSIITAKPKSKTLKVTQYSAKGSLFMSSWDPIGVDGFTDTYSRNISDLLYSGATFEAPSDASIVPDRATNISFTTKMHREGDKLVGDIPAPADALVYNSAANKWEKLGEGKKARSVATYKITYGNFHHGIPMSFEDYKYADAFITEWRTKDGEDDKWYDAEYDSQLTPMAITVATTYDAKNNTITNYADYAFPADKNYGAGQMAPPWSCSAQAGVGVSWEIAEALARMVAEGAKSGTVWSFSMTKKGTTQVDVLNPQCVADIKAELNDMIAEKYVPDALKGITTADKAVKRYQAALKFIDTYGHAYISNGPFYLAKYSPKDNYAEVRAFRNGYPYTAQHWVDTFKRTILKVDRIDAPMLNQRGSNIVVKIRASQSVYPEVSAKPATVGTARVLLITPSGEQEFAAKRTAAGQFEVTIPGTVTKNLKAGSYTLVVVLEQGKGEKGVVGTNQSKVIVLR